MEESEKGNAKRKDDIYSKSLRAGNRTYFFDVKSTKSEELYLTITESKRRFNSENGKFFYEKHKLFLYPEDFANFKESFEETLEKIYEMNDGKEIIPREKLEAQRKEEGEKSQQDDENNDSSSNNFSDISFDDLGDDDKAEV